MRAGQEVYRLPESGVRAEVLAALVIGAEPYEEWESGHEADDGLIDHPTQSTPILIEILDQHPLSRVTQTAAYLLGEIGYKQGKDRDPRIVASGLRFLERTSAAGIETMWPALGMIRELVRAGPIPEASPYARAFLREVEENGTSLYGVQYALGVLYENEKLAFIEELGEKLERLDPEHPLHEEWQSFIKQKIGLRLRG